MSRASLYYTDKYTIKELYKMMYVLHNVLLRHNVPYFAIGGTLLGVKRHKGIIPWDNDIDIGVNYKDVPIIISKRFREDLKHQGYILADKRLSVGWLRVIPNNNKGHDMDIFPVKIKGNSIYYEDERPRSYWPKEYFKLSEVFPLKEYKFGSIMILGPKDPKPFLTRSYGKDWNTVGYITQDPKTHVDIDDPIKLKVTRFTAGRDLYKPPKSDPQIHLRNGCPLLCNWNCGSG